MSSIAPVLLGVISVMVADRVEADLFSLDWWLVCCPCWLLAAAINRIIRN